MKRISASIENLVDGREWINSAEAMAGKMQISVHELRAKMDDVLSLKEISNKLDTGG
jgi:hypothetical protein